MKEIWKNGVVILLIIAGIYIIFLRECKRPAPCPAEDEVLVKKDIWKDMIALADKPAVTHIDTFYIKGETVYVDKLIPVPVVDPADTTINIYNDSLLRKDIDVQYTMKVRGELLNRKWSYNPIVTEILRVDSIYVPKIVEMPVEVPKNGLYLSGLAGGNKSAFLFGGGLDLITKKETMIGYQFQRFGNDNFHSIRFGAKIKIGKN